MTDPTPSELARLQLLVEKYQRTLEQPHMVWAAEQFSVGVDVEAEDRRLRARPTEVLHIAVRDCAYAWQTDCHKAEAESERLREHLAVVRKQADDALALHAEATAERDRATSDLAAALNRCVAAETEVGRMRAVFEAALVVHRKWSPLRPQAFLSDEATALLDAIDASIAGRKP